MAGAKSNIVEAYVKERDLYISFAKTLMALIERLLTVNGISVHSISSRCKTVESLSGKIAKKSKYSCLQEITDLAGIRIITLFSSDVDVVAELIEREFSVDRINSIDKRVALDPDRFGYLSLHYVVSLNKSRGKLQEYSGFSGLKLEIQVRSILQHTWAEIEHDIGYKSVAEVPKQIRRRFSRLAGLLELADQEFIGIRNDLDEYAATVDSSIKSGGGEILLDKVSLESLVNSNLLCVELDELIAKMRNATLGGSHVGSQLIKDFEMFGVNTLAAVEQLLASHKDDIVRRAEYVARYSSHKTSIVQHATCLFFLVQVLAAATKDRAKIERYVLSNEWDEEFIDYLMEF